MRKGFNLFPYFVFYGDIMPTVTIKVNVPGNIDLEELKRLLEL